MLNIPDIPGVYKEKIYEKTWFKVSMGTLAGAAVMFGILRGCDSGNHDNNECDDLKFKKTQIEMEAHITELQDSLAVYKDIYLATLDSLQACHKRCPVAKKTAPKKPAKKTPQKTEEKHVVKRDSVIAKPNKDTVAQVVAKDTTSKSGVVHHTITQSDVVVYTIQYGRGK